MNHLRVIHPYLWNGLWVFDDPAHGLDKEALVAGMPEIIELATKEAGIKDARKGFNVIFSHQSFPGCQFQLHKCDPENLAQRLKEEGLSLNDFSVEHQGTWYEWRDKTSFNGQPMKGWLCPALFKYFPTAPEIIYCQCLESPDDN